MHPLRLLASALLLTAGTVGDLLPALAMSACGLYGALPAVQVRGMVKPELAAKLRPLGMLLAAAGVVLGLLHLLMGGTALL